MADRFYHPLGKKSQKVAMRGGKMIRKTGESPTTEVPLSENVRRRRAMLEEAAGESYGTMKQKGVSSYLRKKKKVTEGLEEAAGERKREED